MKYKIIKTCSDCGDCKIVYSGTGYVCINEKFKSRFGDVYHYYNSYVRADVEPPSACPLDDWNKE